MREARGEGMEREIISAKTAKKAAAAALNGLKGEGKSKIKSSLIRAQFIRNIKQGTTFVFIAMFYSFLRVLQTILALVPS